MLIQAEIDQTRNVLELRYLEKDCGDDEGTLLPLVISLNEKPTVAMEVNMFGASLLRYAYDRADVSCRFFLCAIFDSSFSFCLRFFFIIIILPFLEFSNSLCAYDCDDAIRFLQITTWLQRALKKDCCLVRFSSTDDERPNVILLFLVD